MPIIMHDFNAQLSTWCNYDISNYEGVQIDSIASMHRVQQ